MTSKDLATLVYPYIKKCINDSKDLGVFWKTMSRPAWFTLTRIGVEVAIGLSKPKLEPILKYLVQILPIIPDKYLLGIDKDFLLAFLQVLQTPKEDMLEVIQDNFRFIEGHYANLTKEDLAEIAKFIYE